MDKALNFINEHWEEILAVGIILDGMAGYIPDKYLKYIGGLRRLVNILHGGKR